MHIDLETGISLKIEGTLGEYQTLPVDALIKISQSLQELVLSIAKNDIDASETIDLNNFKLELIDFTKSSSVPKFAFTNRKTTTVTGDTLKQRKEVNEKFNLILFIANTGDYYQLRDAYPKAKERNEIVEKVYDFTNSFKDSPVKIFGQTQDDSYKIHKFKTKVKKNLLVVIKEEPKEKTAEKAFATVKITSTGNKERRKIQKVYKTANNSLSYSPKVMNINGKQYIFNYPLRCLFQEEEDFFVINNEQLGIIGTGMTQTEAEQNFNEEFDFLYTRLNSLSNDKIGKSLLNSKTIINLVVKQVI